MKHLLVIACAVGLSFGAASAQTAPDPAPTVDPAPAAAPATPAVTAATPAPPATAMQTPKEVRGACRSQAIGQGLAGPARKAFVNDCFAKARPDLAKVQQCRQQADAKHLVGRDRHAFVKSCRAGA